MLFIKLYGYKAVHPGKSIIAPCFVTVQANRDVTGSSKKKGGGIVLYMSEWWCLVAAVIHKECDDLDTGLL